MNKQELIERIEGLKNLFGNKCEYIEIDAAIKLIEQLDEPQKPVVPQFVANWYEDIKVEFYVVLERLVLNYQNNTDMPICKWFLETEGALTILINMHQFGYTVEKEKRYTVKLIKTKQYLYCRDNDFTFVTYTRPEDNLLLCHTRKELEEAGFEEVFNSPLFEVEEVE